MSIQCKDKILLKEHNQKQKDLSRAAFDYLKNNNSGFSCIDVNFQNHQVR